MGRLIDLTNRRFGKLLVISRAKNFKGRPVWNCKCDCGIEKLASSANLNSGDTKSCGCLSKDLFVKNLIGKTFGNLLVVSRLDNDVRSKSRWECRCDCGKIHCASGNHLLMNQVKSCGCWWSHEKLLEEAKKRFFENIEKTETCWIWKGCKCKGYGVMFYKKNIKAHRFSFLIHHGKLDSKKLVCHHCDNPLCVNPEHIYQGSVKDNSRDALDRNRMRVGELHHRTKLKNCDVLKILNSSEKGVELAKKYGLSENQISQIRTRKSWTHLLND